MVMTKKLVENKYILFRLFVPAVLGSGQYRCRLPLQVMGSKAEQLGPWKEGTPWRRGGEGDSKDSISFVRAS